MLTLFKKRDEYTEPAETLESRLASWNQALNSHDALTHDISLCHVESDRLRDYAEACRRDPIWWYDHSAADLERIDGGAYAALKAEGVAKCKLLDFEANHGTRAEITARIQELEDEMEAEEKKAIRDKVRDLASQLVPHLEDLRKTQLELDQIVWDARKRWTVTSSPVDRCGLDPEFHFDTNYPDSTHSRTVWGRALVSIFTQFPDLMPASHPLRQEVKALRQSFGWEN